MFFNLLYIKNIFSSNFYFYIHLLNFLKDRTKWWQEIRPPLLSGSDPYKFVLYNASSITSDIWYEKYLYQFIGIHIDTSPNEKSDLTMKSLFDDHLSSFINNFVFTGITSRWFIQYSYLASPL